jgi:hypothetical protein
MTDVPSLPPSSKHRQLAEAIAEDLFVNGCGDVAERLVLTVDSAPKRDLGGWSKGPLTDRIELLLRRVAIR